MDWEAIAGRWSRSRGSFSGAYCWHHPLIHDISQQSTPIQTFAETTTPCPLLTAFLRSSSEPTPWFNIQLTPIVPPMSLGVHVGLEFLHLGLLGGCELRIPETHPLPGLSQRWTCHNTEAVALRRGVVIPFNSSGGAESCPDSSRQPSASIRVTNLSE